jgi:hypothetical protein
MKIFFTPGDLSRISVSVTLGPIAETVFALALLGRPGSVVYEEWRAQVHRALGGRRAAVGALTRALRPVPDLGAIAVAGGVPRFVPLEPPDWRLDPGTLAAAFGPRTARSC